MQEIKHFDVCIIGGGLAGLSLSILLAKSNIKVYLIEKNSYPSNKVCGEYVSNESWNFLQQLGVPLQEWNLPTITTLQLSSVNGGLLNTALGLGGFGISRFTLDEKLYKIALKEGVQIVTETQFLGYQHVNNEYVVNTNNGAITCKLLIAATGKYSTKFFDAQSVAKNNFVGIKYHVTAKNDKKRIGLYAFPGGYAGFSAIEKDKFCLCYLVKAAQLKKHKGNIKELQNNVLSKNKVLKEILENVTFIWEKPVVISNIYFGKKHLNKDGVIYIGDSAAAIPPLCGNGMSIALRSAALLAPFLIAHCNNEIDKQNLEMKYEQIWDNSFKFRIRAGIIFQKLFFAPWLFHIAITCLAFLPFLQKPLIRLTHGKSFNIKGELED
jgi:menaquinone-9 beta-reductase